MQFIKGADISIQNEIEQLGARYYSNGREGDAIQILSDHNINAVRLRIWCHPYNKNNNSYGGGTNDLPTTIKLAKRAVNKRMLFLLDIHYSDFWADPKNQFKPKAWQNISGKELEQKVYDYTFETISELSHNGVLPDIVQIGNEITNGFLFDDGQFQNTESMVRLLTAGINAVKMVKPQIKIMIHLDWGGNNKLYRNWFDKAEEAGLNFDMIGLSYYPFLHGTIEDLVSNMNDIAKRYQKDLIVVETGFAFTTQQVNSGVLALSKGLAKKVPYNIDEQGQSKFMLDLMNAVRSVEGGRGLGFFYWEPTWINIDKATWASDAG